MDKLATGQFPEAPFPTVRSSVQNPPPLEDIPKAPIRKGTSWPNGGSTSENLLETRKDWPIPPTTAPTSVPTVKTEAPPQVQQSLKQWSPPDKLLRISHGDHIALYAKKIENMRRTGMEIYKTHEECCPKMHTNPNHRVLSILSPSAPSHKMFTRIPSAPSPKTFSASSHNCRTTSIHLTFPTDMHNR